jgi:4-hydroxy-tetrahydrodipicolinate reductase
MDTPPIGICVAGCTGWTGNAIVRAVLKSADLKLSGAIARSAAGQDVGTALGLPPAGLAIARTIAEALQQPTDVLIDYTSHDSVKERVLTALNKKCVW